MNSSIVSWLLFSWIFVTDLFVSLKKNRFHIWGIHLSFSIWLTSLCMIISRSIHVAADAIISSFYDRGIFHCTLYYILFIRSSVSGHLDCFDAFSSVQFSHSVMSDSFLPHELQHTRPPCPSPASEVYTNSCPLSQWCHPTISSSVVPFSSCLQSFPASGSFQISQFFTLGGQSIGVSGSASVLPLNIQDWFPLGWTGWISLLSKGLSSVFSNTTVQKH